MQSGPALSAVAMRVVSALDPGVFCEIPLISKVLSEVTVRFAFSFAFVRAGVLLAVCLVAPAMAADQTAPAYRLTKTIALGGGERWDYVVFDSSAKRVYVAHGDHVTVVDEKTGDVIGQIGPFPGGTHGIAVST